MTSNPPNCPICGHPLLEVEAALNRTEFSLTFHGLGNSQLEILMEDHWMPFMTPARTTRGLYCTGCGVLTLTPSIDGLLGKPRRAPLHPEQW